jgi:hypothetical protein
MCYTTHQDANLYHDFVTGRARTGINHCVNQGHRISYCIQQKTIETAKYGSEFMVDCQAAQQIINLSYTLCMMDIHLDCPSCMFCNNASPLPCYILHSTLNKRHNVLFQYCVQG